MDIAFIYSLYYTFLGQHNGERERDCFLLQVNFHATEKII